jgi:hypothetical protein
VVDSISRIKSPFRFKSLFIAIIIWAAVYWTVPFQCKRAPVWIFPKELVQLQHSKVV